MLDDWVLAISRFIMFGTGRKGSHFLIRSRQKPYALVEAKLNRREVDLNLRYFADRLNRGMQYSVSGSQRV